MKFLSCYNFFFSGGALHAHVELRRGLHHPGLAIHWKLQLRRSGCCPDYDLRRGRIDRPCSNGRRESHVLQSEAIHHWNQHLPRYNYMYVCMYVQHYRPRNLPNFKCMYVLILRKTTYYLMKYIYNVCLCMYYVCMALNTINKTMYVCMDVCSMYYMMYMYRY